MTRAAKHVYKGIQGIKAISKETGVSETRLYERLARGMSIQEAVETPKMKGGGRRRAAIAITKPISMKPLWALALGVKL